MATLSDNSFTYICIHLNSSSPDKSFRLRLERHGIECLDEGAECEMFGIVKESESVIKAIESEPGVTYVEKREPPCCK